MVPKFIYFDLGNVLLYFDHALSCRQMAAAAGLSEQQVREAVFDSGLQWQYEAGQVTSEQFYEEFCRRTDKRPAYDKLAYAAGAIFRMNASMKPVLAHLKASGFRLGLLSNTCEMHWDYFASGRYAMIPDIFDVVTLSFRVGTMKPDPKIYTAAAEAAQVRPEEIFFMDDTAGHVAAARACGYDAVQYTDTPTLVADLRKRGVQFNY
ncbi:MAG TPA: HAD family phosphatase [Pirellulales bacterium]|jgi:epoxide hydrolase-like predicted phosphatase